MSGPSNDFFGPPPSSPPVLARQEVRADPFAASSATGPEQPRRGGREGMVVALAAVLGAVAVLAAIVWFTQRDDETAAEIPATTAAPQTTAPQTTAPPSDEAPPTTAPPTTDEPAESAPPTESESADEAEPSVQNIACPEGTPVEVCDAAAFVENVRGRPFQRFPVVEFEDDAAFEERLFDDLDDESIAETELQGEVLGSLGLIPPGVDLAEVTIQSLEIGVVGFYDSETEELVVRGAEIDPFVELVIVHELVHAHDDQWLDLDRPEFDDTDDESFLGFLAVVEGNASRIEDAWRAQLSPEKAAELSELEFSFYGPDEIAIIQQIPSFVLETQFFPYQDGPVLVEAIIAAAGGGEAGERAVDEAILEPPTTSEQALHPEQFLTGDLVAPTVPEPSADGPVVDEGVIGELVFDLWFGDAVGDGWNGDRYVSFERDGQTCTVIHVAADSERDLAEILDAATTWVGQTEAGDQRRVDTATVDGADLVVIEGCR